MYRLMQPSDEAAVVAPSLPAQGKTAIYGYARNEALPAKEESLQK